MAGDIVRVDETPAGDSSEQESPCDSQNRRRPMDMNNSLNILVLVHTIVQGGPVGPQGKEPLALLVLDHADPVGWYAVVQKNWARLAQKLKSHLRCRFLFMLTLLASVLLFTTLRV